MVWALDNENDSTADNVREYTPESATNTLPLVRRIVQDIVRLNQNIEAQKEQLSAVDAAGSAFDNNAYRDEVNDVRDSLIQDEEDLDRCLQELAELGIQPHVPIDGFVDFPACRNRRRVKLCWNILEDKVCHWHEVDRPSTRLNIETAFDESRN